MTQYRVLFEQTVRQESFGDWGMSFFSNAVKRVIHHKEKIAHEFGVTEEVVDVWASGNWQPMNPELIIAVLKDCVNLEMRDADDDFFTK